MRVFKNLKDDREEALSELKSVELNHKELKVGLP